MLVICNGMPRSASTWSFNIARTLLRAGQSADAVYGGYNESIADFLSAVPRSAKHAIIKCHALDATGQTLELIGAAKVIYTWRQPADAIASFMPMFSVDFEHAFAVIENSLRLYRFHRENGLALVVGYQEVIAQPEMAIGRIAAYLGCQCTTAAIQAVAAGNSLERMRQRVSEIGAAEFREHLIKLERTSYDPETLLNLNHIRDGRSGYGLERLTPAQAERVAALERAYRLHE